MNDLHLTKRCAGVCQRELPATEEFFNKHPTGKYGLQPRCKDCKYEENRQIRLANPEKKAAHDKKYAASHPEKRKEIHLRHRQTTKYKKTTMKNWLENKYGLTEEQYQALWDKQGGLCAICGKQEEITERLHVDHDHERNVVRGLLCGKCNRGIGMFDDRESLLQKAIEYLRQTSDTSRLLAVRLPTPQKEVSVEAIKQLRSIGFTQQRIADVLDCSNACVCKKLNGWPESELEKEAA